MENLSSKQTSIDWQDPTLERWLGSITRKSTLYSYRDSFKTYVEFTGLTASEMIDEALGKILGMAMAYGVSSLGLLLAYYNYRKRIVKADQIFTARAKAIIGLVVGIVMIAVIWGAISIGNIPFSMRRPITPSSTVQ